MSKDIIDIAIEETDDFNNNATIKFEDKHVADFYTIRVKEFFNEKGFSKKNTATCEGDKMIIKVEGSHYNKS